MDAIANLLGYQVTEQLYSGSRTLVYRGLRESDQKPVVIKLLRNEYPTFNELIHFRNQYTITKNLGLPSIVKPLDLIPYKNAYALVMEDFGGISLSEYLRQKTAVQKAESSNILPLADFLDIAIQLATSLDGLIHQRVIHKDIKPANILINPDTKEVKLIDFSISSLLPRETQEIQNPNVLEGTIAYLSPEQTGRMNRGIDYRTDFYSLGITFYELLTGQLPFVSNDPMELVHCHIAKIPPTVHTLNPAIPPFLSLIVSKLMAKNAENRYQSAFGLKYDLEIWCSSLSNTNARSQWQETGTIPTFEIGQRDQTNRFLIPEKLYGREQEVETLLNAFERVSQGCTEMMLVAGFSGIGKTVVVNEVHKPIVRQRGYFIKGKYDQFQRNIPFSAFVQAFRDLMGQLLSESDAQLQTWKTKILSTVGGNGQVLIDVIPELESIIGIQLPASELSGSAAQNRFNLLMQKFVQVFTTAQHPLVMFLDDLQWADGASLKLLQLLIEDAGHLLVLGAYRDNEVSPVHPFILTVDEIVKSGAKVNTITLQPLSLADMNQLVADTLNCDLPIAQPLTELVYQKTKGNPFFATQFLKGLHDDGLITFDWNIRYWQCDIAQVRALAITDDVVEFMALQLQKLPIQTQEVIKLAACIGAQFDMNTLAIVGKTSPEETATVLWKALQEGFILPTTEIYKFFIQTDSRSVNQSAANPTYKFLHDRVQQAAYSLIPQEQKLAVHLNIGELLWQQTPEEELEDKLFDIVNQLNIGADLITEADRREELARLNFRAGKKAKTSTAYEAAIANFNNGLALLPANSWQTHYSLTCDLTIGLAEAEYLNVNLDRAEELIAIVLQQGKTLIEQIPAYKLQIGLELARYRIDRSLEKGLQVLEELGFPVDGHSETLSRLPDLADIESLPIAGDARYLAAMDIAAHIYAAAVVTNPPIYELLVIRTVALAGEFGQSPTSAYAYANYGMVQSGRGNLEVGYQAGLLAIGILDRFADKILKCKVYAVFNAFICIWNEPIENTLDPLSEAIQSGLETGDYEYAGYCMAHRIESLLCMGTSLELLLETLEKYVELATRIENPYALLMLRSWQQVVLNLSGRAADPCRLVGKHYDERSEIEKAKAQGIDIIFLILSAGKIAVLYFFGAYDEAVACGDEASPCQHTVHVKLFESALVFYYALALLADCPQTETERQDYLDRVAEQQKRLQIWADRFPPSFQHKCDLIEAEKARIEGNFLQAIYLYDRAISGAKENSFIQDEALANELAAKFYLTWGKEKFAQVYAIEAYYAYSRWGAKAKVNDLEKRYPQLLAPILQQPHTSVSLKETIAWGTIASSQSSSSISQALDLATLLKASQTLSEEIELDKLLATLLKIAIANAGATKCVLLLKQEQYLQVAALVKEGQEPQLLASMPLELSQDVAISLVNTVKRSLTPLVLFDARINPQFAGDRYIEQHQPKSVLCSPILNQGKLIGILYLENNLTVGAFTSDRVEVLNLLCSQAAISLQNARLYQQAQAAFANLKQAQMQIVQSEKMSALGNLVAGVAHEINNPVGFLNGNIYPALDYIQDLFGLLDLYQQKYPQPDPDIQEEIKTIELDYIREDLPRLVGSMREGVKRIKDISTSLRTFSRADSDRPVAYNLHEGLDSTLLILKHRLKANANRPEIQVIKNYGELPQVKCFAGQLNQVFMNLLANAIDALEEANQGCSLAEIKANPNQIIINTELSEDRQSALIQIQDNGMGMSDEVKEKIFDYLFTTKGVGKGTGIGLAIAHQIVVEKHGGKLICNSTVGVGTEFAIALTLKN